MRVIPTLRSPHALLAPAAAVLLLLASGCGGEAEIAPDSVVQHTVENYLEERGGSLSVQDPRDDSYVDLQLVEVHEEVRTTEGERQVICADFEGPDGTIWDLDFYVDDGPSGLGVDQFVLHRIGDTDVLAEARRTELDERP